MDLLQNKKGQGLSLTVIIVAALALIVLVVLVAIFIGRIGAFGEDVGKEGTKELAVLQISYGQCHPGAGDEAVFLSAMETAVGDSVAEAQAQEELQSEITRCKSQGAEDQTECESYGCSWD